MKKAKGILLTVLFVFCAVSLAAEDVTLESDVLKLVLHEQNGSFTLYRKQPNGKLIAMNEVSDNSSSTFFVLKSGNRYRTLRRSYDLVNSAVLNEDGSASLVWENNLEFRAEAKFTLVSSAKGKPADTVRADLIVQNLSDTDTTYAFKAVIDTVLGERSRIHFTTARGTAIRSEKSWNSMVQDKWLSSSNGTETVSFVFAGSAATAPELVLAASRDQLLSDTWKPVVNEERSLTSLQSPNNSAFGIWYRETKLKMFETSHAVFFMTTASDGEVPPNSVLLGIESEKETELLSESAVKSASQIVDEAAAASEKEPEDQKEPEKTIDYAYIQHLLNYIEVLEQSENPDPEEIARLSAEIDAVILELTK